MKDLGNDPKLMAILHSAWEAFAAYGFRKTSMDDIARGAGVSRPALYVHYRNKEDIFRSLVQLHYAEAASSVAQALASSDNVEEALSAAFAAHYGKFVETMLTSQHGQELLDAGTAIAPEMVEAGEQDLCTVYADWLQQQAKLDVVEAAQPAEIVAETILAALKGIKLTAKDLPSYQNGVRSLAALVGRGLALHKG